MKQEHLPSDQIFLGNPSPVLAVQLIHSGEDRERVCIAGCTTAITDIAILICANGSSQVVHGVVDTDAHLSFVLVVNQGHFSLATALTRVDDTEARKVSLANMAMRYVLATYTGPRLDSDNVHE